MDFLLRLVLGKLFPEAFDAERVEAGIHPLAAGAFFAGRGKGWGQVTAEVRLPDELIGFMQRKGGRAVFNPSVSGRHLGIRGGHFT